MQNTQSRDKLRTLKGFALSLLLHLLVVLLFWVSAEKIFSPPPVKGEKKITLDISQFVPPAPPPKPKVMPVPSPQPVIPPRPKPKKAVEKKPEPKKKVLEEKKVLTAKKDIQENNVTKSAKKPEKKIVKKKKKEENKKIVKKKKKVVKKKIVKKAPPKKPKKRVVRKKPRKKQYTSPLANSLMGSSKSRSIQTSPRRAAASSSTRRMIKQLYGSEFDGYSAEQKKFINNNLGIIHKITQMTLTRNGYPETAARTGQQGINVVSFYLHPNGNISSLRLEKQMGYEALDKNTIQVIRLAYKDYPLPRKTTKIKFFVQYSIDGY